MRRTIPLLVVLFALLTVVRAQDASSGTSGLGRGVKARLVFEVSPDDPQRLDVYLRLVNSSEQDVKWTANIIGEMTSQLTDANGKPVGPPGGVEVDLMSGRSAYTLAAGSRMDLRISYNYGVSAAAPKDSEYRVQVGTGVWNIPKDRVGTYSLKVSLSGWSGVLDDRILAMPQILAMKRHVLIDLPPQRIVITPRPVD